MHRTTRVPTTALLGVVAATLLAATGVAQAPPRTVRTFAANQFTTETILWASVGPRSQLVVAQKATNKLFLFSPTGEFLATTGGKGGGPGELQLPLIKGWKGDSLWISDIMSRRVTIFTPDLKYHRSFLWPTSLSGTLPADVSRGARSSSFPQSLQAADRLVYPVALSAPADRGLTLTGAELILTDSTGRVLTSIGRAPRRQCAGSDHLVIAVILCGSPRAAFSPDGRVFATLEDADPPETGHGAVRVVLRSPEGSELFRRTISGPLTPVPARVADSVFARLNGRHPEASSIANQLRGVNYTFAKTILAGTDSSVWVQMETPRGVQWRVLDARGRDVRTVRVDARDEVMEVFANRALAARRDPDTGDEVVVELRW
jgi:hypothetical protein